MIEVKNKPAINACHWLLKFHRIMGHTYGGAHFPAIEEPFTPTKRRLLIAYELLMTIVCLGYSVSHLESMFTLMDELRKIIRVLRKQDETAPHSVLLVLDATTGQNAVQQVRVFKEIVDVTGLVVTKLDGSARGGIVVALAETFGLPVHAVGVGEKAGDLRPFDAEDFARGLVGG